MVFAWSIVAYLFVRVVGAQFIRLSDTLRLNWLTSSSSIYVRYQRAPSTIQQTIAIHTVCPRSPL